MGKVTLRRVNNVRMELPVGELNEIVSGKLMMEVDNLIVDLWDEVERLRNKDDPRDNEKLYD